jgi:hypothetical protein
MAHQVTAAPKTAQPIIEAARCARPVHTPDEQILARPASNPTAAPAAAPARSFRTISIDLHLCSYYVAYRGLPLENC